MRREELEFPVGMGVEEARVFMAGEHSDVRADGLGLVDGDTWVGIAWLDWWLLDNTETVEAEFAVLPSYRRRGVATRLLDAVTGESAGTAFAAARGFVRKHAELHQVLQLPVPDEQLMDRTVPGYEFIQWREHAPDEWIEQFAELLSGSTTPSSAAPTAGTVSASPSRRPTCARSRRTSPSRPPCTPGTPRRMPR